jgi:hypothetical protein
MEPHQNFAVDTTNNIEKISTIRLQQHKKMSTMVISVGHTRQLTCFLTVYMIHSSYH